MAIRPFRVLALLHVHAALLVAASVFASGCAAPADDPAGESSAATTDGEKMDMQVAALAGPTVLPEPGEDVQKIFANGDEFLDYFGKETPSPSLAEGEYVLFVSRAGSAPDKGFTIARAYQDGSPKWQHVQTCPASGKKPYALAKVKPGHKINRLADKGEAQNCP